LPSINPLSSGTRHNRPAVKNISRLAWATAAATLVLLTVGGSVHATGSSLACPDWPLCHGQVMPEMVGGVAIEHTHRLIATLVGVLTLVLGALAWRERRRDPFLARAALALVVLVVVQGVLGGVTVLLRLSFVASMLHLLVSMLFFGTLLTIAVGAERSGRAPLRNGRPRPSPTRFRSDRPRRLSLARFRSGRLTVILSARPPRRSRVPDTRKPDQDDDPPSLEPVTAYLMDLQDRICAALEAADGGARFRRDELPREGGGVSRPRVLEEGEHVEKAAVNFTHTHGNRMPPAATERRPELAGGSYEAVSVSLIVSSAVVGSMSTS